MNLKSFLKDQMWDGGGDGSHRGPGGQLLDPEGLQRGLAQEASLVPPSLSFPWDKLTFWSFQLSHQWILLKIPAQKASAGEETSGWL